jgi:hypothetical protein
MNHEAILTVLPDSKEEAMSLRQIAQAMGLKISSYTDQISVQRRLARSLRTLIKWGWVKCELRQGKVIPKLWHNAYWKTELAKK